MHDQHRVVDVAASVAVWRAEGPVVKTQLRQGLAGLEPEVLDDEVAFGRGRTRGRRLGETWARGEEPDGRGQQRARDHPGLRYSSPRQSNAAPGGARAGDRALVWADATRDSFPAVHADQRAEGGRTAR